MALKAAQKKTRVRDGGPPPAGLADFVDDVQKTGQKITVLFDLWPKRDAFKATRRPNIDLWDMRRYAGEREERKASQAEVFDAMPDFTDEKYKPLAAAMGLVIWIRKKVRSADSR